MSWFRKHCHEQGLEQIPPDVTVDADIRRGRRIFGWNAEQEEIFDSNCSHGYEPVLTIDGVVKKCIYCGDTQV